MWKQLIDRLWASIRKRIEGKLPDSKPDKPKDDLQGRDDVAEIRARDGKVTFWTRNLSIPVGPKGNGMNDDDGAEWILARVHGSGYLRLMPMVMGGSRPPSRVYFQWPGGVTETNGVWPMPLMDVAKWEISAPGGKLTIALNGKVIWSREGAFTVANALMNNRHNRKSTGQWAVE